MIRFIQYPRNSVENLNRALYIKLSKIQWLSARKCIPFPAGKGRCKFPKSTRNEMVHVQSFLVNFFSNMNTRRHPEPRIPPDSRSVQILYRISGMLNESNHSHIGDGTFQKSLHWYK